MDTRIRRIVIPNYIRKFKVSDSVRPLYWEWDGTDIRAKRTKRAVGKPLLKRFIDQFKWAFSNNETVHPIHLKPRYTLFAKSGSKGMPIRKLPDKLFTINEITTWLVKHKYFTLKQGYKLQFFLYDKESMELVLANANKANKANYKPINGQNIYSGNVQQFTRLKLIQQIKESFVPYVEDIEPVMEYPLRATCTVVDTVRNSLDNAKNDFGVGWDIGNRAYPYMKSMLDLLVTGMTGAKDGDGNKIQVMPSKLVEDNRLYLTAETVEFSPLPDNDDTARKLIFTLVPDERKVILSNPLYNKYHAKRR